MWILVKLVIEAGYTKTVSASTERLGNLPKLSIRNFSRNLGINLKRWKRHKLGRNPNARKNASTGVPSLEFKERNLATFLLRLEAKRSTSGQPHASTASLNTTWFRGYFWLSTQTLLKKSARRFWVPFKWSAEMEPRVSSTQAKIPAAIRCSLALLVPPCFLRSTIAGELSDMICRCWPQIFIWKTRWTLYCTQLPPIRGSLWFSLGPGPLRNYAANVGSTPPCTRICCYNQWMWNAPQQTTQVVSSSSLKSNIAEVQVLLRTRSFFFYPWGPITTQYPQKPRQTFWRPGKWSIQFLNFLQTCAGLLSKGKRCFRPSWKKKACALAPLIPSGWTLTRTLRTRKTLGLRSCNPWYRRSWQEKDTFSSDL